MAFKEDTQKHIEDVKELMNLIIGQLELRAKQHDASKLSGDEYDEFSHVLNRAEPAKYGTPEYEEISNKLKLACKMHYASNSHHPEHYLDGISGMDLIDVLEMFCDWMAATKRHEDDSPHNSIEINKKRFDLPEELCSIFHNTIDNLFI